MRELVTTLLSKVESLKGQDAAESQFWHKIAAPSQLVIETDPTLPLQSFAVTSPTRGSSQAWVKELKGLLDQSQLREKKLN